MMLVNSKKNDDVAMASVNYGSPGPTGWTVINKEELSGWNNKLLVTDAHYRQYPYWCKPYENEGGFTPRFYSYRTPNGEIAYACLLEGNTAGMKFGLVFRGPVSIGTEPVSDEIIQGLLDLAKENDYVFVRFTHQNKELTERLLRTPKSRQVESFPFDRDPPRSLIVTQAETDDETLGSFQAIARRNIRAAEKAGYVISKSDSAEDYRTMWPMFERLAEHKSFSLSNRPLEVWIEVIEAARTHGCSMLYTASLDGVCVSAIHLIRYGQTVEFMLGALDLELLGKNPSPSALLHWHAMRDFYHEGCKYYNLGGPGDGVNNKVYPFKKKFHPELQEAQPPVTIVLNTRIYGLWDFGVLRGWLGITRQVRRIRGRAKILFDKSPDGSSGPN